MQYKAKSDWTVKVSMLVGIVMPSFIAFTENWPFVYLVSLAAAALVFGVLYPQRYDVLPDALIIKSGRTTRLITYDRIKGVKPASDGQLSLDYGIGNVMIAPLNPQGLMDDIAQHAPHLKRQGPELVS
jgi:membrane protein YdbS with pleckstrin-like domain